MTRAPESCRRTVAPPALVLALAFASPLRGDEAKLTVADLAAYRAAISEAGATDPPPTPVSFRDLWDHPEAYQGRRVQVEGRIVRRFRQGSFGAFPPLEEAWAVTPAGNLFCLDFPEGAPVAKEKTNGGANAGASAGPVRFVGTFLKVVTYQGGDGPRLAPLIVGPAPPVPIASASASDRGTRTTARDPGFQLSRLDWTVGLGAALVVALILARQHVRQPLRRPLDAEVTAPPVFDDAIPPRPSDSP